MLKQLNIKEVPPNIPTRGNRVLIFIGALFLRFTGWKLEGEFPNERKLIVAVAPHTSNWDFVLGIAFMFCLRLKVSFMGKSDLFFWPFNKFMTWLGGMPVDRTKANGVVAQMVDMFEENDNLLLALAPEGTRKLISPWKTGFIQIANKADVPVQLIGLDYKHKKIVLGPCRKISEDLEAELKTALEFFATIPAKYPEKCDTSGLPAQEK